MYLSFKAIRSGSSGNFYLLKSENAIIAVDMGLSSQKLIISSLAEQGLIPEDLDAVFISHTHTDHISYAGLRVCEGHGLSISLPAPLVSQAQRIYAAKRLVRPPDGLLEGFGFKGQLRVNDIVITPFVVPHDVVPTSGFRFELESKGPAITMATDLGYVPESVMKQFINSDLMVIESNYDNEMLRKSARSFQQVQRIKGPYGHLSNLDTARMVHTISKYGRVPDYVMLAHLSGDHNRPELALKTVKEYLISKVGSMPELFVASRSQESDWITVS